MGHVDASRNASSKDMISVSFLLRENGLPICVERASPEVYEHSEQIDARQFSPHSSERGQTPLEN
jgi:hypothetical protein